MKIINLKIFQKSFNLGGKDSNIAQEFKDGKTHLIILKRTLKYYLGEALPPKDEITRCYPEDIDPS